MIWVISPNVHGYGFLYSYGKLPLRSPFKNFVKI